MALTWPLLDHLHGAERVLIAGAGGGFDLYSGLPLAFALEARGHSVHLANLTFAPFHPRHRQHFQEGGLLAVDADSLKLGGYAPERDLCAWYREELGREQQVWIIPRMGYWPVFATYQALVEELRPDAVVLVDGGTDSLLRGDEETLGTPEEDLTSLVAVHDLEGIDKKALVCLGFGVDAFHGVCGAHLLEAWAALTQAGASLGVLGLTPEMEEVGLYVRAVDWVQERTDHKSIVCASVSDGIRGHFGDHHSTQRTAGTRLFINPLMSLAWATMLNPLVQRGYYAGAVRYTRTWGDVRAGIQMVRKVLPHRREWETIPH